MNDTTKNTKKGLPARGDQGASSGERRAARSPDGSELNGFNLTAFAEGGSARFREEETGELQVCPYDEDTLGEHEWWKGYDTATDGRTDSE